MVKCYISHQGCQKTTRSCHPFTSRMVKQQNKIVHSQQGYSSRALPIWFWILILSKAFSRKRRHPTMLMESAIYVQTMVSQVTRNRHSSHLQWSNDNFATRMSAKWCPASPPGETNELQTTMAPTQQILITEIQTAHLCQAHNCKTFGFGKRWEIGTSYDFVSLDHCVFTADGAELYQKDPRVDVLISPASICNHTVQQTHHIHMYPPRKPLWPAAIKLVLVHQVHGCLGRNVAVRMWFVLMLTLKNEAVWAVWRRRLAKYQTRGVFHAQGCSSKWQVGTVVMTNHTAHNPRHQEREVTRKHLGNGRRENEKAWWIYADVPLSGSSPGQRLTLRGLDACVQSTYCGTIADSQGSTAWWRFSAVLTNASCANMIPARRENFSKRALCVAKRIAGGVAHDSQRCWHATKLHDVAKCCQEMSKRRSCWDAAQKSPRKCKDVAKIWVRC